MAVGKNKGLSKGGKKGVKKKVVDPFTRKDWYDVKAPSMFATRQIGKTLVNRTQGTNDVELEDELYEGLPRQYTSKLSVSSKKKPRPMQHGLIPSQPFDEIPPQPNEIPPEPQNEVVERPAEPHDIPPVPQDNTPTELQVERTAGPQDVDLLQELQDEMLVDDPQEHFPEEIASEGLKFRVFEVSLADLQSDTDAERSFRKFRLIAEDVQGRNVLTNFHGMDLTTDKLRSMVKKWQTLIEANVDVKTTDGYLLRVFCIGFTNKDQMSQRKTCYAQHTQVRAIRKKMVEKIMENVTNSDLKEVVNKLLPDSIAKDIEKACQGIYPLHDVYIRKVKVLKKPRFDLSKLLELHGDGKGSSEEPGAKVDRPEGYEPPVQEAV